MENSGKPQKKYADWQDKYHRSSNFGYGRPEKAEKYEVRDENNGELGDLEFIIDPIND